MSQDFKNYDEAVSNILKSARKRRKYTLKQLAEKTCLSKSTVANYENNIGGKRFVTLEKICEALNCDFPGIILTAHEMVHDED